MWREHEYFFPEVIEKQDMTPEKLREEAMANVLTLYVGLEKGIEDYQPVHEKIMLDYAETGMQQEELDSIVISAERPCLPLLVLPSSAVLLSSSDRFSSCSIILFLASLMSLS